jgi:hypothetical protein
MVVVVAYGLRPNYVFSRTAGDSAVLNQSLSAAAG